MFWYSSQPLHYEIPFAVEHLNPEQVVYRRKFLHKKKWWMACSVLSWAKRNMNGGLIGILMMWPVVQAFLQVHSQCWLMAYLLYLNFFLTLGIFIVGLVWFDTVLSMCVHWRGMTYVVDVIHSLVRNVETLWRSSSDRFLSVSEILVPPKVQG